MSPFLELQRYLRPYEQLQRHQKYHFVDILPQSSAHKQKIEPARKRNADAGVFAG